MKPAASSNPIPAGAVRADGLFGLAPGWYGKLPSLGDFASRRMPADFLHAWDAWLAAGLADWSAADPQGWLEAYLAAPSWRFLMAPGAGRAAGGRVAAAQPVVAGVLMPSVDRVGRYFPFTLVRALPRLPADATETRELLAWLHRADDLAVDALHDNWTVESLEAELSALAVAAPPWFASQARSPRGHGAAPGASGGAGASREHAAEGQIGGAAGARAATVGIAIGPGLRECSPCTDPAAVFGAQATVGAQPADPVWWLCGDALGALHLRISHGLPERADFAALLGRPIGGASAAPPSSTFNPGDLP